MIYQEREKREKEQFCWHIIPLFTHFLNALHRPDFTIPEEQSGFFLKSERGKHKEQFPCKKQAETPTEYNAAKG